MPETDEPQEQAPHTADPQEDVDPPTTTREKFSHIRERTMVGLSHMRGKTLSFLKTGLGLAIITSASAIIGALIGASFIVWSTHSSNETARAAIESQERISNSQADEDRRQSIRGERRVAYGDFIAYTDELREVANNRSRARCSKGSNTRWGNSDVPCGGASIESMNALITQWKDSAGRAKLLASEKGDTQIRIIEGIVSRSGVLDTQPIGDSPQASLSGLRDHKRNSDQQNVVVGALVDFERTYRCEALPDGPCKD